MAGPDPDPAGSTARDTTLRSVADGPLPGLLLLLTMVTGAVDAVSILRLGRVFVANMTGNVVFVGFAIAGAPGFALGSSLVALAGFLAGAGGGGRLAARATDRARLLLATAAMEGCLAAAALAVSASGANLAASGGRYSLSALLAVAMGVQNASARRLAVADLTTTVLTMTLTGLAADLRQGGWKRPPLRRRLLAVAAMLAGALGGAELVLHQGATGALVAVTAVLGLVTAGAALATRDRGGWRAATRPT